MIAIAIFDVASALSLVYLFSRVVYLERHVEHLKREVVSLKFLAMEMMTDQKRMQELLLKLTEKL